MILNHDRRSTVYHEGTKITTVHEEILCTKLVSCAFVFSCLREET